MNDYLNGQPLFCSNERFCIWKQKAMSTVVAKKIKTGSKDYLSKDYTYMK